MKRRAFWLLSDGKTVREVSWREWSDIAQKEYNKTKNTRLICTVSPSEVYIRKGNLSIWIPTEQLKEILSIGITS